MEVEKTTSRNSAVVVTTAFGEEIEDEILEVYFENKRKSGGGTIESYVKKDDRVIITFQNEQGMLWMLHCLSSLLKNRPLLVQDLSLGSAPSRNGILLLLFDMLLYCDISVFLWD